MKHAVMTALAVTLLSGTSALAQEGMLGRLVREAQSNQNQSQRAAPPQRESRPQQQAAPSRDSAPAQAQSRGDGGRRGGQPPLAGGAQPSQQQRGQQQQGQQQRGQQQQVQQQRGQQQRGQQQQGGWQGQRRPDGQGAAPQGRPGAQANGGQGRGQGANGQQGQGRPDGQYNRREDEGPLARAYRESQRGYDSNNRPGWNDRGNYDRRPVIRPEDRRDRDRNRPRYDQRRFPHYVTSQQRYRWYGPVWRAPVGFYSFRWQWGQTLPWSWYTPDYYLNDYWRYGLPMPPIGCEWVRVGDDAILVDVFNGRIYQVVYNLFW